MNTGLKIGDWKTIDWKTVVFWASIFALWFCAPTEGAAQVKSSMGKFPAPDAVRMTGTIDSPEILVVSLVQTDEREVSDMDVTLWAVLIVAVVAGFAFAKSRGNRAERGSTNHVFRSGDF